MRYDGYLGSLDAGFERRGTVTLFESHVGLTRGDLISRSGGGGTEYLVRGTADVSLQLRMRPRLFAGLEVALREEEVEHRYPQSPFPESFDVVTMSLSPVVTWAPSWRDGTIRVRGSLTAVTLVDREYSRTKAGSTVDEVAGPTTWSSGSLEVSRLFNEDARVSWRVAARASAASYRVDAGATNLDMRLSATGRLRLGRIE
jgi:hypothetical protein